MEGFTILKELNAYCGPPKPTDWSTFVAPVKVKDNDFVVGCNKPRSGFIDNYGEIDS